MKCLFCKDSKRVVCAGFHKNAGGNKQRYKCNSCGRRFVPNDGFWKMKTSPEVIVEAISCKKRGMPYRQVSKHFQEYDHAKRSHVSVYKWTKKYGRILRDFSLKQTPNLSGKINLDEFVLKIKKQGVQMGCERPRHKVQDCSVFNGKTHVFEWIEKTVQAHQGTLLPAVS